MSDQSLRQAKTIRVLIVEDEYLVALNIATILEEAGCEIVGIAGSVPKALRLLDDEGCDAAVLDGNLHGLSSEPVAAALRQHGKPFLMLSGYAANQPQSGPAEAPYLAKPYLPADLVAAVLALKRDR